MPQIYYVGLLAGENDLDAVERTGEGRAINRHDYRLDEIQVALQRPVVRRLVDLIRLRNTHPAFDGELDVEADDPHLLRLRWGANDSSLELVVDVETRCD